MPNYTTQDLHVVGNKADIDRFIRTGFSRHHEGDFDDLLLFTRLCPLKRREAKTTYMHDSGIVLTHFRTRTQALFSMITGNGYTPEFYERLARHWPGLSFGCAVNEEMNAYGGILLVHGGKYVNLVKDYDEPGYSRRIHAREIRKALNEWGKFLTAGRSWVVLPFSAWEHRYMPFDAHFDDDFWFYFKNAEDVARFKARYRTSGVLRLVDGKLKRTRLPRAAGTRPKARA